MVRSFPGTGPVVAWLLRRIVWVAVAALMRVLWRRFARRHEARQAV